MSFETPSLLWLLIAVPVLAGAGAALWRRRLDAAEAWVAHGLWPRLLPGFDRRRVRWTLVGLTSGLGLVIVALAGPTYGVVEEQVERRGVDLVFVLDSSLSMTATDVAPDRLSTAKTVIRRLLDGLPGHRVALVQTEGSGDVLAPLTHDRVVVDMLLTSVEAASLPTPGTKLRGGIEQALELLPEPRDESSTIVVVSDGEDHGEDWDDLLEELEESGTVVHALGVGTETGSPLPVPGSGPARFKVDRNGNQVVSRLQPARLQTLSNRTGGVYLHVDRGGVDLGPLVGHVEAARDRSFGESTIQHEQPRFQWALGLALLALVAHLATHPFSNRAGASP